MLYVHLLGVLKQTNTIYSQTPYHTIEAEGNVDVKRAPELYGFLTVSATKHASRTNWCTSTFENMSFSESTSY